MEKAIDAIKRNKKIYAVVALIVLLILTVILLNFKNSSSAPNETYINKSDDEISLSKILSGIEGVGKADVLINHGDNNKIDGVIVVCEGANNIMTRNNIINAVCVALKVDKNNIAVYAMN